MQERRRTAPGRGERRKGDVARIADTLKRRGRISMHVHGTGMMPLVRPGDVALIHRGKLENMRSGDVVLFQRGEQIVAKRIGEEEDLAGEATISVDVEVGANGAPDVNSVQEFLGKILQVNREQSEIERSEREAPQATVSFVLKAARKGKRELAEAGKSGGGR